MTASQMSLQEVAEALGVHYMTVYRYVRTGRLPATQVAGEWRVRRSDVSKLSAAAPRRKGNTAARMGTTDRLEQRLIAGDEAGAWQIVEESLTSGADASDVLLQLISPALVAIGSRWSIGELGIADEHRASAVAQRLIARLGPRFARRGRKRGTVVIAALSGDRHSIPIAIAADVLRGAGFDVVEVGADTPSEALTAAAAACLDRRLVAIVITLTTQVSPGLVRSAIADIRAAGLDVPIVVGGAAARDAVYERTLRGQRIVDGDATNLAEAIHDLSGAH